MKNRLFRAVVGILLAIVVIAGLCELGRARTYQVFGRLVAHVDTRDRRVALTFDDGPTLKLADSIARVLSARRVRATFFVIGADLAHVLERVRPGSIILLHPWYGSRATSLAAIGPLIDSLHARRNTVGTVGDLLRDRETH